MRSGYCDIWYSREMIHDFVCVCACVRVHVCVNHLASLYFYLAINQSSLSLCFLCLCPVLLSYLLSFSPFFYQFLNTLNAELNPICYLLALLGAHHFLHVSRIRVKSLTFRLLISYIYGAPILDVSRSHTTTHHSR